MENKLKNKMNFTENLAGIFTERLNLYIHKEGIDLLKLKLGIEIILINLTKFTIIFSIAAYTGLIKESILMSTVFASLRKSAFGIHAKNSVICTIVSVNMFVTGAYMSRYIPINNIMVVTIFTFIITLLYKYAPADTESHPLLSKRLRDRLRKKAAITGLLLMIITLIIPSYRIKAMITIASCYEVINILPITYKILKRRYRNYEKFERANN
ncbi:accessory gene regulator B family protein [Clostridium manihotivorum]|uniref:Putative AgrB-like protein n=1 Tax=Clostridium manihotivorum TaxID=2320868 RepID=A0A3R5X0B1_9CLOT|nr:accessory gene regulator B family protein [Clostridium manihotivorum]QAA31127.1 accessory regulator AgrB [Clostridium manihotivorum]